MYRKNLIHQWIYFSLVNATTGAALTGATVTAKRSIDGAAQASATGTVTEDAGGQYHLDTTAADTNGNNIGFLFTATNAIPVSIMIVTTAADPTDSVRFGLTALPNAAAGASTGLPLAVDSSGRVDVLKINGTSQTARDIGASVLLSSGTGTGQVALTAGAVTNVINLINAPADPSGVTTLLSRVGAPAGASIAADVAAVKTDTGGLRTDYTTARAGYLDTLNGLVAAIWAAATRTLTAFGFSVGVTGDLSATMKTSVETAVWDATAASHNTAGTTGAKLNSAASAGDPWATALPGAYAAGTAGQILGALSGLVAAIWSYGTRTLTAFGFTVPITSNSDITAIKGKTDQLTFTTANRVDATVVSGNPNTYQQQGSGDSPFLGR